MKNHALHLNTRRCIGCHGCEVHCKVNKNLPVGVLLCHITVGQLKKAGNVPQAEISFSHCYHCEQPLCVAACPVDAMIQRKDGIVFIDQEKCIGCMACTQACPWDIPVKNPQTGKAIKCDLCYDRIDAGLRPACVTKCTTHALQLVHFDYC